MRIAGLSVASIAVTALLLIIVAGSGAMLSDIGPWYASLRKPRWNPPNWVFAPAWTTIYALTGTAVVVAWNAPSALKIQRVELATSFIINLALNVGWSALFFARRRPDWALIEVVFLWLSIVSLLLTAKLMSGLAAALLVPYLVWVTFAGVLNRRIVALNGPFTEG